MTLIYVPSKKMLGGSLCPLCEAQCNKVFHREKKEQSLRFTEKRIFFEIKNLASEAHSLSNETNWVYPVL